MQIVLENNWYRLNAKYAKNMLIINEWAPSNQKEGSDASHPEP